ncbi:mitogen-activated protein kinase [Malassezia vespertilionis]|uniref:Mitogen-activated protein kinase n=1 Tax=Malassezia vespertilionis TaxID=2020962 RepID=A0A2N1JGT1_9BASI|nr:mitogen-activated protein kinase [Malassezia vespertilionis]PKI85756.1 Pmk1p [Malassezia vespertilionis]WFD04717.1 mitogen-activated protein kinase [Malassezia vespertilionis]
MAPPAAPVCDASTTKLRHAKHDRAGSVQHTKASMKDERRAAALRKAQQDLGSKYRIGRVLGEGGYGIVFSARERGTEKRVAIKRIAPFEHPLLTVRTLRELRILRHFGVQKDCDIVIALRDVVISGELDTFQDIYLVQERMDCDLHHVIRAGEVTSDHAQYLIYQLLVGLKFIHSAGVIHRDIKPSNLLVNTQCDLRICDFGLARSIDGGLQAAQEGFLTEYVATRWYRAPEIMLSSKLYTQAVDIWSVGCTLYEMLMGRTLFPGKDYHHQLGLILDVLGTPGMETLRPICSSRALDYVHQLPRRDSKPWESLLPNVSKEARDFIARTVTIDPTKRMTAAECLAHPYLKVYHDEFKMEEVECPRLDRQMFYFDFEPKDTACGRQKHREELWRDAQQFSRPGI